MTAKNSLKLVQTKPAAEHQFSTRNIQTTYYGKSAKDTLKINLASDPECAVLHAVRHMRKNSYGAFVAEIIDRDTTELHAVIKMSPNGDIRILFERKRNAPPTVVKTA